MGELNGKSMLVVGASPGIGRAICARLVSEGATVHVADINATLAQETATAVGATPHSFDCTSRESTRHALASIGKIDAMVCIVATFFPPDAEGRITEDQWRKTFEINLLSMVVVADEAAKVIDEGSIVLVSSANAVVAKKGSWAYDTSKAALNHLIREMAVEFAPRIRVNGIAPATVVEGSQQFPRERTITSLAKYGVDFDEAESTEELRSKLADFYAQRTLLKAKVTPKAVAEAVFLLVSDRLKLTTGHILPVDAGLAEGFLTVKIKLDYAKAGLDIEVPDNNLVAVLGLQPSMPLDDTSAAVAEAVENPIGSAPLSALARGKRNACIVICDITRPVPNELVLTPVLSILEAAGIQRRDVTILIATGTHRPNHGEELVRMLGPDIPNQCRIVNHICTDEHVSLGTTENGVPVTLNAEYLNADLKITAGMIEPHFMAGYAGGRKMVMPGIAGLATVQAWHSPKFLEHPNAINGIVEGNPVHEESMLIAKMAPPDMIIDVALDSQKRACRVFAGDLEEAWYAGVEYVRGNVLATVPEPVDIVVTSCGGYPLDLTFYQTVKGMVGALPILKPNGTIIIASSCSEGIGNKHFADCLFETEDIEVFAETIQQPDWKPVADQWQIEEFSKARRGRVVHLICEGIPDETARQIFVSPAKTVEEAIESSLERHGASASIAVIPKGPYVLPQLSP